MIWRWPAKTTSSTVFISGRFFSAFVPSPSPTYVSAMLDFPRPNTVKELQGFLGLLNFYRRFLPAVARTLQPLTDALRGDRKGTDPVEWSAEMEAAFTASKKALASAT